MDFTIDHNSETITGAVGFKSLQEFVDLLAEQGVVTNADFLEEIKHKTRIGFTSFALAVAAIINAEPTSETENDHYVSSVFGLVSAAHQLTQSDKATVVAQRLMYKLCDEWNAGGKVAAAGILRVAAMI